MSKKYLYLTFILVAVLIATVGYYQRDKEVKTMPKDNSKYNADMPKEVSVDPMEKYLKCNLAQIKVVEIGERQSVIGSNYLNAFPLVILNYQNEEIKAYYISETNESLGKSEYMVSTDCQSLSDMEVEKYKNETQKSSCMGFYYWNKKTYQLRRECGFFIDEKVIFYSI